MENTNNSEIRQLMNELVKQNILLGQRIDATNKLLVDQNTTTSQRIDSTNLRIEATNQRIDSTNLRIEATNQRIDTTLKQMYELQKDSAKRHEEAVNLFYVLRESLERLPDVIKEQIGFKKE